MGHRTAREGYRVLICAPYGRDADSVADLLAAQGYDVVTCDDLSGVAGRLGENIGAVLLTEEALTASTGALVAAVERQPPWSDIPFVLLAAARRPRTVEAARARLPDAITNVLILERPLGRTSLTSATASAMRSRQKQFEMRDRLSDLAESESRLRLATASADIGTWDLDPINDVLRWDERCKALFGVSPEREVTYTGTFLAGLHPDDREATQAAVGRALDATGDGAYDIAYRAIGQEDGVERWIAAKGGAVIENGRAVRFIGTVRDITAAKTAELALARSEEALRRESRELDLANRTLESRVAERTAALEAEMANRLRVEETLRQSQKMEAVGQLTGGIAHDFNNMLTGVIGALDVIKRRIAAGRVGDMDRFIDAAQTSAQRAAALTARLLAFSRRQSLDLKPVDVNALALSLEDLLRRSVREDISLRIAPAPNLPRAVADANQLENAILNLVINARDAMPQGGQLTIETGVAELDAAYASTRPDVTPGRYVVVAVSDTGVGMPPEVVERVFEPFFSTKPTGQGTGLGLSMVYGFARQANGQVRIHSREGEGTSVKIYLPITEDEALAPRDAGASTGALEGHGQTILLVEDDEAVRLLIREVLTELGYDALEARDADQAIAVLHSDRQLDLMISDVGLPGMNGRQLAEVARRRRPDLPILFVTGYAENAAIRAGFLGANMSMITKPFAIEELATSVAAALAGEV